MKVSIIGSGYVGLITGVCLAAKGHQVINYDINAEVIDLLNQGIPHFYEYGLQDLLSSVVRDDRFRARLISGDVVFDSDMIMVAVETPSSDGKIDLSRIKEASKLVGQHLKNYENFVSLVIKSTVIPGTTDSVVRDIVEGISGKRLGQFGLGMNPEFLREGHAVADVMEPDRVILGHDDPKTLELLMQLYEPWDCDKIPVNTRTAEMVKYVNNSLLATLISTVNEVANIADAIGGIDIMDVMKGIYSDKRWSPILPNSNRIHPEILTYLVPGSGFGGSCFPKDVTALGGKACELGIEPYILNAVLRVNENQPYQIIKLLEKYLNDLEGKRILLLGLAFNPGTDDIRESVSLKMIDYFLKGKAQVFAHDPAAIENTKRIYGEYNNLKFVEDWSKILKEMDAVVIATKWTDYQKLSSSVYKEVLSEKVVFDVRRLFKPTDFPDSIYLTIGRSL